MSAPKIHDAGDGWWFASEARHRGGQAYVVCPIAAFLEPGTSRDAFYDFLAWGEEQLGGPVVFYDDGAAFHLYPRLDFGEDGVLFAMRISELLKEAEIDVPRRAERDAFGDC